MLGRVEVKFLQHNPLKIYQGVPGLNKDPVWRKWIFSSISVGDELLVRIISVTIAL